MSMRDQGVAAWTYPNGKVVEMATYTCPHCNCVVHVPPKADPSILGGFCGMCHKPTCTKPECNNGCSSFERQIDAQERKDYQRRSLLKAVGV